tara:strand:+ start:31 stop:558 length:528 start_codon:yes stop_codon:yes gene_type:complete
MNTETFDIESENEEPEKTYHRRTIFKNKSSVRKEIIEFFEQDNAVKWKDVPDSAKKQAYKNAYHRWYMKNKCKNKTEYNRKYYQKNREKLLQWQKEWRADNRPKILATMRAYNMRKRREAGIPERKVAENSIECPCGGRYTPYNKTIHCKTKKHRMYLEEMTPKKRNRGRPRKEK